MKKRERISRLLWSCHGRLFSRLACLIILALLLVWQAACAGPLRDRMIERAVDQEPSETTEEGTTFREPLSFPGGIRIMHDISYGNNQKQTFDIYSPPEPQSAPVIFMVHGGAWFLGDKTERSVIENKVARWVPRGFIVISTNYRMLPEADPLEQAKDVARAVAAAQN